jgi:hypothetical protein
MEPGCVSEKLVSIDKCNESHITKDLNNYRVSYYRKLKSSPSFFPSGANKYIHFKVHTASTKLVKFSPITEQAHVEIFARTYSLNIQKALA